MHIICIKSVLAPVMLWMDLWVHPYTVTAYVQLGVNFWNVTQWMGVWVHPYTDTLLEA